jgi:hypothetical protein
MYTIRCCIRVMSFTCAITWFILSMVVMFMISSPSLSPRLASFIHANRGTVFLLCVILLPLARYLHPPKAYGYMTREQRRELMRIPLTVSTGRSAAWLFIETCILVPFVAVCAFIFYLALLDFLRPSPGSPILYFMGTVALCLGCLALKRIHRFMYPL